MAVKGRTWFCGQGKVGCVRAPVENKGGNQPGGAPANTASQEVSAAGF